ncbi:MAG: 50S ribosome-binding GTPase [Planctomycetes bacterium]|nr:50S ribosome-binding GTPase [Planctomycetota bacterium]
MDAQPASAPKRSHPLLPPHDRAPVYEVLTPAGQGAIATLLLDGDGAVEALGPLFRSRQALDPNVRGQLVLGRIVDASGRVVDEAVAAPIPKEESETGCEQVELSCHGGVGATQGVCATLEAAGFRATQPGELFARGHRAAKLSLPTIEARLRLPQAATMRQAGMLLNVQAFQSRWERHGLDAALGSRERRPDWREGLHRAAAEALDQIDASLRLLRTHRVVIAGPVNAGKSTLSNRILRADASIVSATPGTTRDLLERPAGLRGLSLLLTDTAGLREHISPSISAGASDAEVEKEGQARARRAAEHADLVLVVLDGSRVPSDDEMAATEALAVRPHLLVLNKSDQGTNAEAAGFAFALGDAPLAVSALSGDGLAALENAIERALFGLNADGDAAALPAAGAPFTERHRRVLVSLKEGLEQGLDGSALVGHIRSLVGTRPNEEELAAVFAEAGREEKA